MTFISYKGCRVHLAYLLDEGAYMIDPLKLIRVDYEQRRGGVNVWDFFKTFKPPNDIGFGKGKIYDVKQLDRNDLEYRYVAFKFGRTINGRDDSLFNIKKTFKRML